MGGAGSSWRKADVANRYLERMRGRRPLEETRLDVLFRLIEARGEPIETFVDLGCGDGVLADEILTVHPGARAVLLDHSEPMLSACRSRFDERGLAVRPVLADLSDRSWPSLLSEEAPFDLAVSAFAIHHLPTETKRRTYEAVFDLLAPGGLFVNLEHVASPSAWLEAIYDDLMVAHLVAEGQEGDRSPADIERDYRERPDQHDNVLDRLEHQCEWLEDIGFRDVDCYVKLLEIAMFGGRKP
jgi:tRNA (cmo5U34)-methyltransferase